MRSDSSKKLREVADLRALIEQLAAGVAAPHNTPGRLPGSSAQARGAREQGGGRKAAMDRQMQGNFLLAAAETQAIASDRGGDALRGQPISGFVDVGGIAEIGFRRTIEQVGKIVDR